MKSRYIWMQLIIKHVLISGLLWYYFKPFMENEIFVIGANNSAEGLGVILILSGLILAGTISGYLSFSYLGVNIPEISYVQLVIGHIATFLLLLTIGILLIVAVSCLSSYTFTSEMGNMPLIFSVILYFALIFYDVFDLLKIRHFD